MRHVEKIIIHCAATPNGKPFGIEDIDRWHIERGFHRGKMRLVHRPHLLAIGYHFVILTTGEVELGRHTDEIGAHAAGHNSESVGICMVGTDKFTAEQWESLAVLVQSLWSMYPNATVCGHRDFSGVAKSCPNFDAAAWAQDMGKPAPGHLLEVS